MKPDLLTQPLNYIFFAPSHISIYRALQFNLEGMSGREVGRRAGINHQACLQSLGRMETLGIVERRGSGNTQLFTLNRKHFFVSEFILPFLKQESTYYKNVINEVSQMLKGSCESVFIFGSAARRETTFASDLDILVIAKNTAEKEKVRNIINGRSFDFHQKFGLNISQIIQTAAEIKRKIAGKDKLINNILKTGNLVLGKKIEGRSYG